MPIFTTIFMFLRDIEFLHNLFKYFLSPFDKSLIYTGIIQVFLANSGAVI